MDEHVINDYIAMREKQIAKRIQSDLLQRLSRIPSVDSPMTIALGEVLLARLHEIKRYLEDM